MKRIVCGLFFVLAASVFAQQQLPTPPASTPPTFPEERFPQGKMPPDSNAQTQPLSNTEVRQSIQQKLHSEPELANARVQVRTNNKSVMLTGKVGTEHQHALVLRIAQSFASSRKVIDKIKLQQRS